MSALGRRRAGGGEQTSRFDLLSGHRRRQVRRGRRPVAVGRDLLVALPRPSRDPQQLMVRPMGRSPADIGPRRFVEAGDAGLKTATRLPSAARVWARAAATTVLPTSVPVPVTKTPRRARARSTPQAASGWGASEAELARGAADQLRGALQLLGAVGGHHREAQARGALGHGRWADALGEDAALEHPLAEVHRRSPRRRPRSARSGSGRRPVPRPVGRERGAQSRDAFACRRSTRCGWIEQLQRRRGRRDRRRRRGGGEDEGAGAVDQVVDRLGVGADVGAVGAERLAEGADDDVDLAAEAGGGDRTAPAGADRAGGVGLVDHQPAAVAASQLQRAPAAGRRRRPSRRRRR